MAITSYQLLVGESAAHLSQEVMHAISIGKQPFGLPLLIDDRICQVVTEGGTTTMTSYQLLQGASAAHLNILVTAAIQSGKQPFGQSILFDEQYYLQAIVEGGQSSGGGGGADGTNGKTILNGTTVPSNGLGTNGDFYINTVAWTIHGPKASGVWPAAVSLIGPQGIQGPAGATGATGATGAAGAAGSAGATGAQGPQGPQGEPGNGEGGGTPGADGRTVLSGTGAPEFGNEGDFYIDTAEHDIYGPASAGFPPDWPGPTSLIGPPGADGENGVDGLDGMAGPQGEGAPVQDSLAASTVLAPSVSAVNTGLAGKVGILSTFSLGSGSTAITHTTHANRFGLINQAGATTGTFAATATSGGVIGDSIYLQNVGAGLFTASGAITAGAGYKLTAAQGEVFTADYDSIADAWRSTTPNLDRASGIGTPFAYCVALSDGVTALTTGLVAGASFRLPFDATNVFVSTELETVSSSGAVTLNVLEAGVTIFTTQPSIAASGVRSGLGTPAVMSDTAIAAFALITFNITAAGTGAKGFKAWVMGIRAS